MNAERPAMVSSANVFRLLCDAAEPLLLCVTLLRDMASYKTRHEDHQTYLRLCPKIPLPDKIPAHCPGPE